MEQHAYPPSSRKLLNADQELRAVLSLRIKFPLITYLNAPVTTLQDGIASICSKNINERKILLIYLHNSSDPFSKVFCESLQKSEVTEMLNRNFVILGWDIEDSTYHDALISALNDQVNLTSVGYLISEKISIALCILPVEDTISVFTCLRGNVSFKDIQETLKQALNNLNAEKKEEDELRKYEEATSTGCEFDFEEFQTLMADYFGNRDYDRFEYHEHELLKQSIGYALKGPPQDIHGYKKSDQTEIETLFKIILKKSNEMAEYKDMVEISFIYNCVVPLPKEKIVKAKKYADYNPKTDFNTIPVFVLRRCRSATGNPCRVFIDDKGRVYNSWRGYLTKNKLPECEMVLPLNGRYEAENGEILLEKHLSPACHLDTKLLEIGDITGSVVGLISGGIFVAAAIPAITVAPAVLLAGGIAGVACGIWAIARSVHTIKDRHTHSQTLSFANSEARGAYLNILAGSLGFAGAGANMAVAKLAARGVNIGRGASAAVNTIGIMNIGAGGASVLNSGYEIVDQWLIEERTPSPLAILQLTSSVLFFGHAVYNFKSTGTIIEETQANVLQDYQESLRSNKHRKTFGKLIKATVESQGDAVRGRAEVISAIRNISDKDGVFAALTRNNKLMNKKGVNFIADHGQLKMNGIPIDMNEFMGLNKKQTEVFLSNVVQQQLNEAVAPSAEFKSKMGSVFSDTKLDTSSVNLEKITRYANTFLRLCDRNVQQMFVQAVHEVSMHLAKPLIDMLDQILPKYQQGLEILRLVMGYFSKKADELEMKYRKWCETKKEEYYHPLFDHINPEFTKHVIQFFEVAIAASFSAFHLTDVVLQELSEYIVTKVSKMYYEITEEQDRSRRRKSHSGKRPVMKCTICKGDYFKP